MKNYLFYFGSGVKNIKDGRAPIYVRITVKGNRQDQS